MIVSYHEAMMRENVQMLSLTYRYCSLSETKLSSLLNRHSTNIHGLAYLVSYQDGPWLLLPKSSFGWETNRCPSWQVMHIRKIVSNDLRLQSNPGCCRVSFTPFVRASTPSERSSRRVSGLTSIIIISKHMLSTPRSSRLDVLRAGLRQSQVSRYVNLARWISIATLDFAVSDQERSNVFHDNALRFRVLWSLTSADPSRWIRPKHFRREYTDSASYHCGSNKDSSLSSSHARTHIRL